MVLNSPDIQRRDYLQTTDGRPESPAHVLVVVFLRGGADGLTLVPPAGDDEYHRQRPTLAVRVSDTIDLDGYFGLNPHLQPLASHFEAGELAIFHGAGSEDHTRSHFEAQDTMEHGGSHGSGWLARYLRARDEAASALSAVAIGTTLPESLRGSPSGAVMQTVRDFAFVERDDAFVEQLSRLYAQDAGPAGLAARGTIDAVRRLRTLRAEADLTEGDAAYPRTQFARGMREIARLIKADVGLVATTINLDGWDTHIVQAAAITQRMQDLADGLDAFRADLGEHRRRTSVVVMTEFGRRLRENSSFGTDHGAGGVMMLLGAAVPALGLAGVMRSSWPDLSQANLDEVGDVPAGINYRDILGPVLALHSPKIDLGRVFPDHTPRPIA